MSEHTEFHRVDKVIEIEARIEELCKRAAHLEHIKFENLLYGDPSRWAADWLDETDSELRDLQETLKQL